VVAADHEVRGDRRPVGAGCQVGEVTFQPGQVPGLGLELAVDGLDRAVQGEEDLGKPQAPPLSPVSADQLGGLA
jgi:hypothetical protein